MAVQSLRVIRRKIRSVNNIKKITRAMEMVSAAKLKKVQERLLCIRPFSDKIVELVESLAGYLEGTEHPLFTPQQVRGVCIVMITSDKGLCGSFNVNILRYTQDLAQRRGIPVKFVAIGKKGADFLKKHGVEVVQTYTHIPTEIPFGQIQEIVQNLVRLFETGSVGQIDIAFTRYINALTFRPGHMRFLPIELPEERKRGPRYEYIFEPKPQQIVEALLPKYLQTIFHRLLLESMCSEHAARMNAMRNATDNAQELIESLTLTFNKARQASITKELLDIVGGAEALR